MKAIKFFITLFALLLVVSAQAQDRPADLRLDPDRRSAVIEGAADAFEQYHVDETIGREIAALIRQRSSQGKYDGMDALALTEALGADLDTISDDHLNFAYFYEGEKLGFLDQQVISQEARATEAAGWRRSGFGIAAVERLEGNIGYLKLDRFAKLLYAQDGLVSAMKLVAGAEALILDLRDNRGGDSDTVNFVFSWFMPEEPVHYADWRLRSGSQQIWTLPGVPVERFQAPVYVLTSGNTYSAGEWLAYALQAHDRAEVIGEKTVGADSPARFYVFDPNFAVQVPWAEVTFLKTGRSWEGGVVPDVPAPASEAKLLANRQLLLELAERTDDKGKSDWLQKLAEKLTP